MYFPMFPSLPPNGFFSYGTNRILHPVFSFKFKIGEDDSLLIYAVFHPKIPGAKSDELPSVITINQYKNAYKSITSLESEVVFLCIYPYCAFIGLINLIKVLLVLIA